MFCLTCEILNASVLLILALKTTTRKPNSGTHSKGSYLYVQEVHNFHIYSDVVQITFGQQVQPCEGITSRC
jgi:hypothetical protein